MAAPRFPSANRASAGMFSPKSVLKTSTPILRSGRWRSLNQSAASGLVKSRMATRAFQASLPEARRPRPPAKIAFSLSDGIQLALNGDIRMLPEGQLQSEAMKHFDEHLRSGEGLPVPLEIAVLAAPHPPCVDVDDIA